MNVPVLARTLEAAGLSTVLVTMMPYWAERMGVPRALAVEFPFGHTLGQPHNVAQQLEVIRQALAVLATAVVPNTIVHSTAVWPQSVAEAVQAWQPERPSPIIAALAPQFREMLRRSKRGD